MRASGLIALIGEENLFHGIAAVERRTATREVAEADVACRDSADGVERHGRAVGSAMGCWNVDRRSPSMGCCLFAIVLAGAPRFALVFWWLFQTKYVNTAFSNLLFAILGFLFLPWTTLMWVMVYPGGISIVNWVFLGLAFLDRHGNLLRRRQERPRPLRRSLESNAHRRRSTSRWSAVRLRGWAQPASALWYSASSSCSRILLGIGEVHQRGAEDDRGDSGDVRAASAPARNAVLAAS